MPKLFSDLRNKMSKESQARSNNKMKKLMCSIFGCKMDSNDIADYTCPRCGTHHKIDWPRG